MIVDVDDGRDITGIRGKVEIISHPCCNGVSWRIHNPVLLFDGEPLDPTDPEPFMIPSEVARRANVKTETISTYRRRGTGPKGWVSTGPMTGGYPVVEVERWLAERRKKRR